jgi:hypothetical protein
VQQYSLQQWNSFLRIVLYYSVTSSSVYHPRKYVRIRPHSQEHIVIYLKVYGKPRERYLQITHDYLHRRYYKPTIHDQLLSYCTVLFQQRTLHLCSTKSIVNVGYVRNTPWENNHDWGSVRDVIAYSNLFLLLDKRRYGFLPKGCPSSTMRSIT